MVTRLARTLRLRTLLSPIGRNAFVLIRSAILRCATFSSLTVVRIEGAKRSFVAGVVMELLIPEHTARHAAPLSLRVVWRRQGGTGNLFAVVSSLFYAIDGVL